MSIHSTFSKSAVLASVSAASIAIALAAAGQAIAADATATADSTAATDSTSAAPSVAAVIVTAERRATDIQKTPAPITAVTGVELDQTFVTQIAQLSAGVPSLEVTHTSGTENIVTIRGVGSETPENTTSTSPGVSAFIDGVYLVNSIALNQTLFDIDHIEVLRGPQGDLYGESSIGGAIVIVTQAPQLNTFGASGEASVGDYNLYRFRAELNVPLGDDFAIRLSAQRYQHQGFSTDPSPNLLGYQEDDANDYSLKASLLWKPTDRFTAQLTGEWYQSWTHGAAQKNIVDPDVDPRKFDQDFPNLYDLNHQLYHLNMEWDTSDIIVKSVTGVELLNDDVKEDSSRGAYSYIGFYDDVALWTNNVKSYTEEFDLLSKPGSPLEWTAGSLLH